MPFLSTSSFSKAGKFLAELVEAKNREFVEDLANELITRTPVCTGYAAASWYVTPGIPKTKNDLGDKVILSDYYICKRIYTIKKIELSKYKRNWGQWYIVNLAEYIEQLEDGSSDKAPEGFISDTIFKHIAKANNMY